MSKKQFVIAALALHSVSINSVYAEMMTTHEIEGMSKKVANNSQDTPVTQDNFQSKAISEIPTQQQPNQDNRAYKTDKTDENQQSHSTIKPDLKPDSKYGKIENLSDQQTGSIYEGKQTKGLLGRLFAYFND